MNDIVTVQEADDDAAVGDMTWIEIAVLGSGRGAVVLDYSDGWRPFIEELHVDDVFDEMPLATPDRAGAYRWTGYKIGSWQEGDAIVLRGGSFAPQASASAVTVAEYNEVYDKFEEVVGGAFRDGFEEGWIFAQTPDGSDYDERKEEFGRAVDIEPSEAWGGFRDKYAPMLPVAALPPIAYASLAGLADPVPWEPEVGSVAALARAKAEAQ